MADTTLCLILNLYRRTYWLANMVGIPSLVTTKTNLALFTELSSKSLPATFFDAQVKEGKKITGPEQLKDAAFGCARIRGDTLGIVGLGKFH